MEKLVFLDRDGVINKDPMGGYVTSWGKFHFIPGAIEGITRLTQNNFKIFVISNQAGVGKGIYSQKTLNKITQNMLKVIKRSGGRIDGVYYCPHKDEDNCNCRKPKTGLFFEAVKGLDVDFKDTYLIGDSEGDIQAGEKIGSRNILVLSGKTNLEDKDTWQIQPDFVAQNLLEATNLILRNEKISI